MLLENLKAEHGVVYAWWKPSLPNEVKVGKSTVGKFCISVWKPLTRFGIRDAQLLCVEILDDSKQAKAREKELHQRFTTTQGEWVNLSCPYFLHWAMWDCVEIDIDAFMDFERTRKREVYANNPKVREKQSIFYKERYANDPEYRERIKKQQREKQREKMKDPEYRKNHLEYLRKYRAENKERSRERQQERYQNDPEYRERNREHSRNYQREQRKDPEYRKRQLEYKRNRRRLAKQNSQQLSLPI